MGNSESSSLADIEGFQVGRILPKSPAHISGLCTFFDIITGINNMALEESSFDFFKNQVVNNKGKTIILTIFNLRLHVYRDVELMPSNDWGGVGLLGCEIEWNTAEQAMKSTWHIVDVHSNSPASANPDIMPHRDFLIGMQHPDEQVVSLFNKSSFTEKLEGWRSVMDDKWGEVHASSSADTTGTLLLLIFDSIENVVKEVLVDMGGSRSLGIDIADGYLHFIPSISIADPADAAGKLPYIKKFFIPSNCPILCGTPSCTGISDARIEGGCISQDPIMDAPTVPQMTADNFPVPPIVGALPFPSFPLPSSLSKR